MKYWPIIFAVCIPLFANPPQVVLLTGESQAETEALGIQPIPSADLDDTEGGGSVDIDSDVQVETLEQNRAERPVARTRTRSSFSNESALSEAMDSLRVVVHEPQVIAETSGEGDYEVTVSEPGRSSRAVKAEDHEIERIKSLPPAFIPMQNAPVQDAIRLVADAAGMSYVSPENDIFEDQTVSLRMRGNPWDLLQVLSESFGIGMEYRNNIWYFYQINVDELVTRSYRLRYNAQETAELTAPSINNELSSGNNSGAGSSGVAMGGGGGTGSSGSSGSSSIQVDSDKIIAEIEKLVATPTSGLDIVYAEEYMVGEDNEELGVPGWAPTLERTGESPEGTVIWDSDNRRFLVTATRQQHKRVEKLLEMIDRPQTLIKISSVVVETDVNPEMSFGVNWDFDFTTRWTSDRPNNSFDGETTLSLGGGQGVAADFDATRLSDADFSDLLPNPSGALLTFDDVQAQMDALSVTGDSRVRQRPTVVTLDNRMVTLQAVTQTPVVNSSTQNNSSVNDTTSSSVSYVSTGTVVSIFPKIIQSEYGSRRSVRLSIILQVSSIVDEIVLSTAEGEENPFPVIAERTYEYEVIVPSGYTLAIGGLAEQRRVTNESGVPVLGDIPGLGWMFKNRTDELQERNLIAYITPEIMEPDNAPAIQEGGDIPMPAYQTVNDDFYGAMEKSFFEAREGPSWSYEGEDKTAPRAIRVFPLTESGKPGFVEQAAEVQTHGPRAR